MPARSEPLGRDPVVGLRDGGLPGGGWWLVGGRMGREGARSGGKWLT
jgi:hypothetical protein